MSNQVTVAVIPDCDIHKQRGQTVPAYADASLPPYGGSWGNVCKGCFTNCGCSLGTGRGQEFVLAAKEEPPLLLSPAANALRQNLEALDGGNPLCTAGLRTRRISKRWGYTFEQWMAGVNAMCTAAISLDAEDMPDRNWHQDYSGLHPGPLSRGSRWSRRGMSAGRALMLAAIDWKKDGHIDAAIYEQIHRAIQTHIEEK
jgi:hypothetical protein